MRAGLITWVLRAVLLATAFLGPVLVFATWPTSQPGNAEQATPGLGWGLLITLAALIAFALSFRTSPLGRLGRFAVGVVTVVLAWVGTLWLANIWPTLG
ncbi:MAG: hypothetical protein Q8J71_00535 [Brevundimonas sp.]|nr:hypothetical protein [Brevundimonas sp.]